MLWYGRTGYSVVAMKMDSRSFRDSRLEEHAIPGRREGTVVHAEESGCPYGPRGTAKGGRCNQSFSLRCSGDEAAVGEMSQPSGKAEGYDPGASAAVWKDQILVCGETGTC